MLGTPKASRTIRTPGFGVSSLVPPSPSIAGLNWKFTNSEVWSFRWGEPVPSATPEGDTNPLWPGGSTLPASRTRALAAAGSSSATIVPRKAPQRIAARSYRRTGDRAPAPNLGTACAFVGHGQRQGGSHEPRDRRAQRAGSNRSGRRQRVGGQAGLGTAHN